MCVLSFIACVYVCIMHDQVSDLLCDNHDLLQEFATRFFPDDMQEQVMKAFNARTSKRRNAKAYLAKIRKRFANDPKKNYQVFLDIVQTQKQAPIQNVLDKVGGPLPYLSTCMNKRCPYACLCILTCAFVSC